MARVELTKVFDCNYCKRVCKGTPKVPRCPGQIKPEGKFMLAELALDHAQSLHNALSALPFETNLGFSLR
jgi:hypothetical protein